MKLAETAAAIALSLAVAASVAGERTAPERPADLAQRRIVTLLSAGLADAAIEAFEEAPAATRSSILEGGPIASGGSSQPDLRLDLAAALTLEDDAESARELLSSIGEPDDDSLRLASDEDAEALLWQALDLLLTNRASAEDPFSLFALLAFAVESRRADLGSRGTVLRALSELAQRERYAGFARFFLVCFQPPSSKARRANRLFRRLLRRFDASSEPTDPTGAWIRRNLADRRLDLFRLKPLPEGVPTGSGNGFEPPPELRLPRDLEILRAEQEGNEALLVGIPLARYGWDEGRSDSYWIARSDDGGATWTRFDTGLLPLRPYEVVERSALPLRSEGGVRVEVRVRKLDEASITEPDFGAYRSLEADGLYLEIPWKALERDRDGTA